MMEKLTSFWWDMETGDNLEETPEMRELSKETEKYFYLPPRIEWVRWDEIRNTTPEK